MAAGLATLDAIDAIPDFYERLEALGARLEAGLTAVLARGGYPCRVARVGSMWTLFFTNEEVTNWPVASRCDTRRFARYFHEMLRAGVSLAPSQFEANFISAAHTAADIDATIDAARSAIEAAFA